MPIQQPDGAVRAITNDVARDAVFAADGSRLYVVSDNAVTAYNPVTGAKLATFAVGTKLGAIDVSPDGRYIVVTDQAAGPTSQSGGQTYTDYYFYRIDTQTGVVTTYTNHSSSYNGSFYYDVAFSNNNTILLSQQYPGSGGTPLTVYNLDARTSSALPGYFYMNSVLTRSADYSSIAIANYGISSQPIGVYNTATGTYAGTDNFAANYGGNGFAQAVSTRANLVVNSSLAVFDTQMHYKFQLTSLYPNLSASGLAFSVSGDKLYVLNTAAHEIYVLNTADWSVGAALPLTSTITGNGFGDTLQLSPDGRFLSVIASDHVEVVDLTQIRSDGGTSGNDTIVGTALSETIFGFDGNDVIDGAAGSDAMYGGRGDDTYYVERSGDTVSEGQNEGFDQVFSSISYTLPNYVEKVTLTGTAAISATGGTGADILVGNDAANTLTGLSGTDVLNGMAGDDILLGGPGSDVLTGGLGADIFRGTTNELNGDAITDLAAGDRISVTSADPSSVGFTRTGSNLYFGNGINLDIGRFHGALAASVTATSLEIVAVGGGTRTDFTGEGNSDLLWRNADGGLSTWTVGGNGTQVTQAVFNGRADVSWRVVDHFDMDGDGRADILWRQDGGAVAVWGATGTGFNQGTYYRPDPVPTSWRIAGTGDLNGDGRDDILWQNGDGSLSAWQSTGSGFREASYTHAAPGAKWLVEALGDFNGDGRADILWRSTEGGVSVWTNDGQGTSFNEGAFYQSGVPTGWHIDGVGDFNGDGRDDLVWRNDNGDVTLWRFNGTSFDESVYTSQASTDWHIAQVGDFNNDGRADLLWHNDNGAVSTWQSNGAGFDQAVYNSAAATTWQIAAADLIL